MSAKKEKPAIKIQRDKEWAISIVDLAIDNLMRGFNRFCRSAIEVAAILRDDTADSDPVVRALLELLADWFMPEGTRPNYCWWAEKGEREERIIALLLFREIIEDGMQRP